MTPADPRGAASTSLPIHPWLDPNPYPIGPRSLALLTSVRSAEHPDRLALIDGDRQWTYGELDQAVEDSAARLAGLGPDNLRICWSLANAAHEVIGFLATMRIGAIWIGLNPRAADSERAAALLRSGATHLISDTAPGIAAVRRLTTADLRDLDPVPRLPEPESIDPLAPALITFTSGSSGTPKGVVHDQHSLLAPGLVSIATEPPSDGERIGTPLSLSIANLMLLGPISALLRGTTAVVMRRTHPAGFAADVAAHSVSRVFVVPTLLHDLVAHDDADLERLDRVIVGGAGCSPDLLHAFTDRFGVRPTLSYGLSEAPTGVVRESLDDPIGSRRGFPLPHVRVEVRSPDGSPAPVGSEGEVCVLPATAGAWAGSWRPMHGYLGAPEATVAALGDGALHTGDRGVLDADGGLSVIGRISDLIIRGGANIDPNEVARALGASEGVAEVCIVGLPDDRLGQVVGALIVGDVGVDDLRSETEAELSSYKFPTVIRFVDELPRNPMGKVDQPAAVALLTSSEGRDRA